MDESWENKQLKDVRKLVLMAMDYPENRVDYIGICIKRLELINQNMFNNESDKTTV